MKKLDLSRLHGRFVKLVDKFMEENNCSQTDVARRVGIQRTHLNAILHKAPNRPLTGYYVLRFIQQGIFKMDDIYDGQAESNAELGFWEMARVADNHALMSKIAKLRDAGIDIESMVDSALKAIEK